MNIILKIIFFISLFYFSCLITKLSLANIVVISYENFSNKNLNLNTLNDHIKILKNKKYYVLTTNTIIDAAVSSKILPNYSVAITITSNKKQIINTVWPLLAKISFPFTLFIDPHLISNSDNNMTWKDIKILNNNGIEIGIRSTPKKIKNAIKLYKNNLAIAPISYQYKLGIWSEEEIKILKKNNIKIAFGDASGPVSLNMQMYKLPRFNISGKFANIERLKIILDTLPLKVTNILPKNNILYNNPPLYGFTLLNKKHIPNCYTNNNNKAEVIIVNENRIEVRTKKFNGSKARINCISKDSNNRLLWHGALYWIDN
jgi:hypothetical protein